MTPDEIGIDELYKVDSPYKATLQKSYEEFKKSKDYKDHKLTQDQYLMAMHHTRSFEYVSIDDEKANIEMWRDIALGVGVVVLTIFCPPAGAVASVVVASADMYSAASGKDWGTGRELDNTERGMRGAFALLDLIPAGKYLHGLAKTGKTAGLTAVKTSLKTTIKEGVEQGVKNLDNFKGLLKNVKGLGDNIYHSLPTYRKQLARHIQNTVDEGLLNLSKAAQEGLERAKQFTLEVPTIRTTQAAPVGFANVQAFSALDTTTVKLGDTGLGKGLDNLASKAKQVENTRLDKLRARNAFYGNKVDDVAKGAKEAAEQVGKKARQEFGKEASEKLAKHSDEVAKGLEETGKGLNKPEIPETEPRFGERKISQEEYKGLRSETPTEEIRDMVNDGVTLPMNDPVIPGNEITKRLEADHIVSMDRITRMDGFEKLTIEQQLEVLNYEDNFVGLSKSANASKGAKTYEDWTLYKKTGVPIDPAFRAEMMMKEKKLERLLQGMIDNFVKYNGG